MEIMLKNVRIAFPALDKPESMGDGEPAFQAKFIIEPGSALAKELDAAMAQVAKDQWKDKADIVMESLKEDKKLCFVHGPYKNKKTGEPYLGFAGMWSLSSRKKQQPTIFDQFGKQVTDPAKIRSLIYSGCYVNAKVDIWAQDNRYGRRINAALQGVMFAADGEAFGGSAPATADDFAGMAKSPEEAMAGSKNNDLV